MAGSNYFSKYLMQSTDNIISCDMPITKFPISLWAHMDDSGFIAGCIFYFLLNALLLEVSFSCLNLYLTVFFSGFGLGLGWLTFWFFPEFSNDPPRSVGVQPENCVTFLSPKSIKNNMSRGLLKILKFCKMFQIASTFKTFSYFVSGFHWGPEALTLISKYCEKLNWHLL